ncbi:MAG: glutamate 5-kinase [Thiotrichales bacterium]
MQLDERLKQARRWVFKIGSALLTDEGRGLNRAALQDWAEQLAMLRHEGREVVLVSSGAVAEGMSRLGWKKRPSAVPQLQAAAAIGQMGLVQAYESCFQQYGLHSAQVLLTHEDMRNRERYLNARSTLKTLLALGVIPVINENDTVATDEIRFGDNDTLGALVANLIEADVLVILTDQEGLYDRDPRKDTQATLVQAALANDRQLEHFAGDAASELSRGGMRTKVLAAKRAARSGTHTIIVGGTIPRVMLRVARGEHLGTRLLADQPITAARKQWIANQLKSHGRLWLDAGAVHALTSSRKSLLAVGVQRVEGTFERGDVVTCVTPDGDPVAQGLINYNALDTAKIAGHPSEQIERILGYLDEPELIDRDNLILL